MSASVKPSFLLFGMGKTVTSCGCGRSCRHHGHPYPSHYKYSSLLIRAASSPASSHVLFTNRSPNLRGSNDLDSVWKYIKGQNLNGAQNSLIDVKPQTDILITRDKNQVCHDFQINLGISLMNYDVGLDWDGVPEERPSYMRTGVFKPCDCKKCFFCLQGHTNSISTVHKSKQK